MRLSARPRRTLVLLSALYVAAAGLVASVLPARGQDKVDTALIVAVDVSQSVDEHRYQLQMEGIAEALEDPDVIAAITSGGNASILFSMITWADRADVVIDWRRIATRKDASQVAALVRKLPYRGGEFTCLARMLRSVGVSILPNLPAAASRVVIDVSGDGIDNCNDKDAVHAERDRVLALGATINGLPIIVAGENDVVGSGAYRAPGYGLQELSRAPDHETTTLDAWFRDHVTGGPENFVLVARGYEDFGRALRQKFVTEVSALVRSAGR